MNVLAELQNALALCTMMWTQPFAVTVCHEHRTRLGKREFMPVDTFGMWGGGGK